MNRTLFPIRLVFVLICVAAGYLVCLTVPDWDNYRVRAIIIGGGLGLLLVLTDLLLKGFSLRGLSAITFGIGVGSLIAYLVGSSPLLETGDPQVIFLSRLGLFLGATYLCTVIALRGKDEFNLVIPYVRFVPHDVEVPLVVVDTSALIDGRISRICETGFMPGALVIPQFVLRELQSVADSAEAGRRLRGRRGLETLSALRKIKNLDLRIHDSDAKRGEVEAKLVFLAVSMKAKLLTTDQNLMKMAEFQGVTCLRPGDLSLALQPQYAAGEIIEVDLVKPGKEEGQAVGYLPDGSMVVVNDARAGIGSRASAEIISVMPSGQGRIVFARFVTRD
ncbi:MAG: twitching motility protein PilT [Opitutaceae bacterium]|jgi:uncharacterized protein YacL|nr:twitching motility protein PilT [Opitutaceae bacterium]